MDSTLTQSTACSSSSSATTSSRPTTLSSNASTKSSFSSSTSTFDRSHSFSGLSSVSNIQNSSLDDPFTPSSGSSFGHGGSGLLSSPKTTRKRTERIYGDRFIPSREGIDLSTSFNMIATEQAQYSEKRKGKRKADKMEIDSTKEEANRTFNALLRSELLGRNNSHAMPHSTSLPALASMSNDGYTMASSHRYSSSTSGHPISVPGSPSGSADRAAQRSIFSFSSPNRRRLSATSGAQGPDSPISEKYSGSPINSDSQRLLLSPRKTPRNLSKVPYKVLDAPELADDFYLNLVDWSSSNVLAVGLGNTVYLWSAATSKVTKLTDYAEKGESVTSLAWIQQGNSLAIGTSSGKVEIWDTETSSLTRTMTGHEDQARVGAMAWNQAILSTGSRDRCIFHRDVREAQHWTRKLMGHKQEVCGLKWSHDGRQLASGGNDNKLLIWEGCHSEHPLWRFTEHQAAVKAIAWNPHQSGILASGGGTADKKIRFWNTLTGAMLSEVDTGSQICNLLFSSTSSELVSTHGFSSTSVQNQVVVWKYPSMQQVATLTGHTYRVLYLAASPDGRTIVTGAGDETLRFWDCFRSAPKNTTINRSILDPLSIIR